MSQEDDHDDRRSYPRVGFKVPAHIYVGTSQELHKGYVLNLSEAGAFVMLEKGVSLGPNLQMEFRIPPGIDCVATGVIVHNMDMGAYQGLGVELTQRNQPYVNFLRNLSVASPGDIMHFINDMRRITVRVS